MLKMVDLYSKNDLLGFLLSIQNGKVIQLFQVLN